MKRVVILEHDGGELANQLWNYASVLAYAFERGWECENWSFFENAQYFRDVEPKRFLWRGFFSRIFRDRHGRKHGGMRPFIRKLYKLSTVFPVRILRAHRIVYSRGCPGRICLLPPSTTPSERLSHLERMSGPIYFANVSGGFFRNPEGMRAHRAAIVERFAPAPAVETAACALIAPCRARYRKVIGVHIRQGDYVSWQGGKYLIPHARVRQILDEYLRETGASASETCFIVTSDGPVHEEVFAGLNVVVSKNNVGADLFALAACDAIIGSHSTFGKFAAWLGDIPHFVMQKESMDWTYYRDKASNFDDVYFSFVI